MAQPHRALGLVAVLAAGAAGPVAIDLALPQELVVGRRDRRVADARRDLAQLLWLLFGSVGAGAPPPRVPWRASPGST